MTPKETAVKICGVSTPETLSSAIEASAEYIGLVFYPSSSRFVSLETAAALADVNNGKAKIVGLFVDPTDQELLQTVQNVSLDMLQLHGDETPQRVEEIAGLTALPVMKAIRLRDADDLKDVPDYEAVADFLLFDNKCETAPGGTGQVFDWSLLVGKIFTKPWMLSGGLTVDNVADALAQLSPDAIDVSSGVESEHGVKDVSKIKAFIDAVKTQSSE